MHITNATYTGKDQDWTRGDTTYWFEIQWDDGEPPFAGLDKIGIVESGANPIRVLDSEGYPIDGTPGWAVSAIRHHCIITDEMRAE